MTNKDTNGPAFPMIRDMRHNAERDHEDGMSLRDYFAAKAMQAMCEEVVRYDQFEQVTRDAYKLADAMLEARK